jgi:phage terminase large subunit-like protein
MDLAQTRDLTAVTRLWHNGNNQYSADFLTWLPRSAVENAAPHIKPIYIQAIESGVLRVTESLTTDYTEIEQFVEQTCKDFDVRSIASDPYNASQLCNNLEDKGLPVLMVRQGISHLSPASKEAEVWITEQRIAHGHDPFLLWQLGNCGVYRDLNSNIKIRKGDDEALKIDSIIALIMAISGAAGNAEAPREFRFEFLEL